MKRFLVLAIVAALVILCGCETNTGIDPTITPGTEPEISSGINPATSGSPSPVPSDAPDDTVVFGYDLVGKTLAEAATILNGAGIDFETTDEYSETVEDKHIIAQSIAPQTVINKGDSVTLRVSKGSEFVTLPDFTGMTKEEAAAVIQKKQLLVEFTETNDVVQKNHVISQSPAAGTKSKIGDTISLQISLGQKQILVENLINHTEAYARAFFSDINLECSVSYERSNTVEAGKVMSQSVTGGKYANEGTTVNLVISEGMVEFEISDYTGRTLGEINALLDGKCIVKTTYGYNPDYDDRVITGQDIPAGAVVSIDDTITLTINNLDNKPVSFADANLELLIRTKINKSSGTLYYKDVKDILNLSNYDVSHDKIRSLEGIENLKSLSSLYLFGEEITDVTPLAGLTALRSLNLELNDIDDISSLEGLVNLTNFAVSGNPVTDISILENMRDLESVSLSGCPVTSIDVIRDYTNMDFLNISKTNVDPQETKEIIAGFTRLRALHMTDVKVNDLDFLACPDTLTYLSVDYCGLSSIDCLEDFTFMKSLKIYHNRIVDISPIAAMPHLKYLWVGYNDIEDVSVLESCANLETLFISEIKATDFSALGSLTNLERLYISSNTIDNIEFLGNLEYLEFIELHSDILDKTNYNTIINQLRDRGCDVND